MLIIENAVISEDIIENQFVCNLKACKGACCVEGDAGAPLELDELPILDEIYDKVKPYLSPKAVETIDKIGLYELDSDGDMCTTTINNRECVFAVYDENQSLFCGIEKAYLDGKVNFPKPISCHLYPIRVTKTSIYTLLNYNRWDICSQACTLGKDLKIPIYKFLKTPLIRKFGADWYAELEKQATKTRS
jgi:hypothetical protein